MNKVTYAARYQDVARYQHSGESREEVLKRMELYFQTMCLARNERYTVKKFKDWLSNFTLVKITVTDEPDIKDLFDDDNKLRFK